MRGYLNAYFKWLVGFIRDPNIPDMPYWMLLSQLFGIDYIYELEMDSNRAHDGLDLRRQFEEETGYSLYLDRPCTVLEMMVALAIRCEKDIMYIPGKGDRTYIWFWDMIESLGLIGMTDKHYDSVIVRAVIFNFLNRMYEPDGQGGLFYVPGRVDMRDSEIWYQMNMYLTNIVGG